MMAWQNSINIDLHIFHLKLECQQVNIDILISTINIRCISYFLLTFLLRMLRPDLWFPQIPAFNCFDLLDIFVSFLLVSPFLLMLFFWVLGFFFLRPKIIASQSHLQTTLYLVIL